MARRKQSEDPLEQKARYVKRLRRSVDQAAFAGDQREVSGELSQADQHPGDLSDVTYGREMEETMREVLDRDAAQIEDAMRRRAEGKYGICEVCGRAIPEARLRAFPEATKCIDCQRASEAARRTG